MMLYLESITTSLNKQKQFATFITQTFTTKPEMDSKKSINDHVANIFKTYFDIGFVIGMCPFRLVKTFEKYIIRTWWLQSLLCATSNALILLVHIGDIRFGYTDLSRGTKNPFNFFFYSSVLCKVILAFINLWQMWFESLHFANLVNFLVHAKNSLPPVFPKVTRTINLVFYGHMVLLCFARRLLIIYQEYKATSPYHMLIMYKWARFYLLGSGNFPTTGLINGTANYFEALLKATTETRGDGNNVLAWTFIITNAFLYVNLIHNEIYGHGALKIKCINLIF